MQQSLNHSDSLNRQSIKSKMQFSAKVMMFFAAVVAYLTVMCQVTCGFFSMNLFALIKQVNLLTSGRHALRFQSCPANGKDILN